MKQLLQLDEVHSRTVRIGSPTMCSKNPTQMVEHTILVVGLRDVHHPPKRIDSARLAQFETGGKVTGNGLPKNPQLRLRVSSNIVPVPVGPHCVAQWRTVSHLVHAQRQPMPMI